MPNTVPERTAFKNAVTLIANKYNAFLVNNPNLNALLASSTAQFDSMVTFMDGNAFAVQLHLSGLGHAAATCQVNGYTSYTTNPPHIYINRAHATPSTYIHELLHFLTHDTFKREIPVRLMEGTTEYFTRKVQNFADPVVHAAFVGPRQSYDTELNEINQARHFLKSFVVPMLPTIRTQPTGFGRQRGAGFMADPLDGLPVVRDFMKKAYFAGDMEAIRFLKKVMGQ